MNSRSIKLGMVALLATISATAVQAAPLLYVELQASTDQVNWTSTLTGVVDETYYYYRVRARLAEVGTTNTNSQGQTVTITSLSRGGAYWDAGEEAWLFDSSISPFDGLGALRYNISQPITEGIQITFPSTSYSTLYSQDHVEDAIPWAHTWAGGGSAAGTRTLRPGSAVNRDLLGVKAVLGAVDDLNPNTAGTMVPYMGVSEAGEPEWITLSSGRFQVKEVAGGVSTLSVGAFAGDDSIGIMKLNGNTTDVIMLQSKQSSTDPYVNWTGLTMTTGVVSGNNSKLWVGAVEPTTSLQATEVTVDFGKVLAGASVSAMVSLSSSGTDAATTDATVALFGGASSANVGLLADFGTVSQINAGLNTLSYGVYSGISSYVRIDNLADSSAGPSQGSDNGYAYIRVSGVVGQAQAKKAAAGRLDFNPAEKLSAAGVTSLVGLKSKVVNDDLPVLTGVLGTEAELRYGTVVGSPTVTMNWRERLADEVDTQGFKLISDVLQLQGIPDGTVYVLQMSYNPDAPALWGGEVECAAAGNVFLAYWDGLDWVNAVVGNDGGTKDLDSPVLAAWNPSITGLGTWGVDTDNHVVWAVLNHSSEFAVVPEPATMAFLVLGGLAMAGAGLANRRRRSSK